MHYAWSIYASWLFTLSIIILNKGIDKLSTKQQKNKKKFKLFDMNRDGKGVYDTENRKPTLGFFFKLFFRKFSQLLQLNLLMLPMVIPVVAILFMFFLGNKTYVATDTMFAPLYGLNFSTSALPEITQLLDLSSFQMDLPAATLTSQIIMLLLVVFLAVTWGWQNAGATYVLRGLFRGDPVFVFSDYFYGIKRNFKQAFFLGLIDFICLVVLIVDFIYFSGVGGSLALDLMYFATMGLLIIYLTMRFYMYNLLVTFDIKNFKLLKNSLIFSVLGLKRNIMAYIGIILLVALHAALIVIFIPVGISIPIILPFVYIMATIGFIVTYAAYPVIEKYMITPYQTSDDEGEADEISDGESEDAPPAC